MSPTQPGAVSAGLAVLAGISIAEPRPMAPQNETKATRGGWTLNLALAHEEVNPVPNLAAAANSREAFVTFERPLPPAAVPLR